MALRLDEIFEAYLAALVSGGGEQAREGGVGGADGAFGVERGDGDRRGVEQAGKSELCGAGFLALSRTAIDDKRMRHSATNPLQHAHGKARAIGLDEVDVEAPRGRLRLATAAAGDQSRAIMRHDPLAHEGASRDLREIESEPLGERGVEIFDIAVNISGKEAGWRAVQIGNRRLYLGEARFLARAILRDLIDQPHYESAFAARARIGRHRLHRDAEPARSNACLVLALARRRQAELLLQAAALLRRAGKTKDRFREMRIAGEGAVRRRHARVWSKP